MKRPSLANFLAIITDDFLSIRASITMKENLQAYGRENDFKGPVLPIQAYRLLKAYEFGMKIIGYDSEHREIFKKTYDSDSFGNFSFKVPLNEKTKSIASLQLYEVKKRPGLEWLLGSYIPIRIMGEKKLIICDFDKTLVETKYSSTKEVYRSLTSPLSHFPSLPKSIELLREAIENGHHPFILSASPHFYEDAIRDWLYQNKIYTAGIFLKDYRQIFSLFDEELTPKDIKVQGMYKLNHLLDIITMTGIPHELILMGDNFESDPIIYLSLARILSDHVEARSVWQSLKDLDAFSLNRKQDSQFLSKIYQIHNGMTRFKATYGVLPKIKIYIRKKANEEQITLPISYVSDTSLLELYEAPSLMKAETTAQTK
jgi:hypothetical protein